MSGLFLGIFVALNFMQDHPVIVNGLKCYECTSTSMSSPCITETGSVSECDTKYCTIYREELVDPAGHLINFYRLCQDNPKYFNTIIETLTHKTYYRSCTTDLCNSGDGTDYDAISNEDNSLHSSSGNINTVLGIGSLFSSQSHKLQLSANSILVVTIIVMIIII